MYVKLFSNIFSIIIIDILKSYHVPDIILNAYIYLLIKSHRYLKISIINHPMLHMKKLKHRDIKKFAQVHIARKF